MKTHTQSSEKLVFLPVFTILKIIAYSKDLNNAFSQQLPRFMYLPWLEEGLCIQATSTSFCNLAFLILQLMENLPRRSRGADFYIYISCCINVCSLSMQKATARIYIIKSLFSPGYSRDLNTVSQAN